MTDHATDCLTAAAIVDVQGARQGHPQWAALADRLTAEAALDAEGASPPQTPLERDLSDFHAARALGDTHDD